MGEVATNGWHVVRFTLTAMSPLSCGAGEGVEAETAIARDAIGVPMIPGATLQGLLRREYPDEGRAALFGVRSNLGIGAGRILCSNGVVHGADDVSVSHDGVIDEFLEKLAELVPLKRDHVRLDHRHGAAPAGKFNRAAVPKGTRFSFEWLMFGEEAESVTLGKALAPLNAAWFCIGSSGSRGFGRVRLEKAHHRFFGLADANAFRTLRLTPLSNVKGMDELALARLPESLSISITLEPVNAWRSGQDGVRFTGPSEDGTDVNLAPIREPEIRWDGATARWSMPETGSNDHYVLPGSSLRGPLAHRALFHWNRLSGALIDPDSVDATEQLAQLAQRRDALLDLFGSAREGSGGEEGGRASPLLFEDVVLEVKHISHTTHVKIDRFTGGATPKALYDEELVETKQLATRIILRPGTIDIDNKGRLALIEALRDLCEGRLALGAKSLGFFKAGAIQFCGADAEAWLKLWAGTNRDER